MMVQQIEDDIQLCRREDYGARGERLYKSFCPLSSLSKAHCAAALCQARHDNFYGLERRELGTNFAGPSL